MRLALRLALTLLTFAVPAAALADAPASLPTAKRTLAAAPATARVCHTSSARAPGIAQTTYRAPMAGFLTVRNIGATRGNWDLAIFDRASGRAVSSSESFFSNEVAQTWVTAGQRLLVQGCHRSGPAARFPIGIVLTAAQPPAPAVPSLVRVDSSDGGVLARLDSLGFDVTHNVHPGFADVIAPSADKLALLRKTGIGFTVRSADLRQDYAAARRADARYTAAVAPEGSPLPSKRTTYRTYAEYQTELAALVKDHPGTVRPVVIGQSYQGRDIAGVEIATDVAAPNDGRPTYLLVGVHHAREWPSGEAAMEYARMLADGIGTDAQMTKLGQSERTVVVPIINPDGFVASRGTNPDPADSLMDRGYHMPKPSPYDFDTVEGVFTPFGGNLAYRRKNCAGAVPNGPGHEEQNLPCYYQIGVDPNRNYGQGWGGVGASSDPNSQSYRGTGQWSEPETQAVWHWSQAHNVTFIMTLHNVAALVLRPPGRHTDGTAPDEARMKQLGDAMADDTGYLSQYGYELYDTSGTTEDWNYGAQAAFGYTIEIGPAGGKFHMPYQTGVVDEWTGTGARAGRGLRQALIRAAESAATPSDHSIIQGGAPAGSVLRAQKKFDTFSSPVCSFAQGLFRPGVLTPLDCLAPTAPTSKPDGLNYTMVVPASGRYEWHVTPSTRPFEARKVTPGGYAGNAYKIETFEPTPADIPPADRGIDDPQGLNGADEKAYSAERRFTLAPDEAGNRVVAGLSFDAPIQDYDLKLYHVKADNTLEPAGVGTGLTGKGAGSSGEPNGVSEQIQVDRAPAGDYVARVIYYMTGAQHVPQANDWHLDVRRYKGDPDKVEQFKEYWTMTCETPDGKVLESQDVYVERGQAVTASFTCGRSVTAVGGNAQSGPATGNPQAGAQAVGPAAGSGAVLGRRQPASAKRRTLSRRAACMRRAGRIRAKGKRRAAIRRCGKRYPVKSRGGR
jgi:hypothetical protein